MFHRTYVLINDGNHYTFNCTNLLYILINDGNYTTVNSIDVFDNSYVANIDIDSCEMLSTG